MKKEILFYSKDAEYGFLSNFYPSPISMFDEYYTFPTVEHYYQSCKTTNPSIRAWIANAPKPYLAKKAGRSLRAEDGFRPDWDDIKVSIMKKGISYKFSQNHELREKLLETGDAVLHENSPTDKFWGMKGEDMLGKLLMELREDLRQ